MHPTLTQALAAERTADLQAQATAARQAREIRRGRRARHPRPSPGSATLPDRVSSELRPAAPPSA
jgi:hypothetical protein